MANSALETVREATNNSPFESQIWLVGGAVRDELLGKCVPADLDLVIEQEPNRLIEHLVSQGVISGDPQYYPQFGTAMIRVGDSQIEIVMARKESYRSSSRKPEVAAATLLEDALRRDFTINTLLKNLHTGEIRDLTGRGLEDVRDRLLRTPREPMETFYDDPLRMLRAVRFKYKLGFSFAPGVEAAIKDQAPRLSAISGERIRGEFEKMLTGPSPDEAMGELLALNLLEQFAPELVAMKGIEQGRFHHLDVWEHSLLVLRNARQNNLVLNLACLFHDIGKPLTRTVDDEGNTRFFSHESIGAKLTETVLLRMKFSRSVALEVAQLVRNHMRLGSWGTPTKSAARRLVRDLGPLLDDLLALIEADAASLRPGVRTLNMGSIREFLSAAITEVPIDQMGSPLSGEEIMSQLGLEPGAEVGRLKSALSELVIEGVLEPGDKAAARQLLSKLSLENPKRPSEDDR